MPSTERVRHNHHHNQKVAVKQQPPHSKNGNIETLNQQIDAAAIIQRARLDPGSLSPHEVQQLQRTIGNWKVERILTGREQHPPERKQSTFPALQAKLMAGLEENGHEQEAGPEGDRPDRVGSEVIQAKLDPDQYSRQAFKEAGLTAGFKLIGKTAFGKILATLDKYYKTDDRREEKTLLTQLITNCQNWLDSARRDKKKSQKKQDQENEKKRVLTDLQVAAQTEIASIDATLDTSLFDTGLEAEMLSKIVAGTAPVGGGIDARTDQELLDVYQTLEPDMAAYAKRSGDVKKFKDRGKLDKKLLALSLPRNPNGSLTPEAIYLMSQTAAEEAKGYVEGGKASTAAMGRANLKKKDVAEAVKFSLNTKNKLTGETQNPDIHNLINASKVPNPDQQVIDTVQIGGVTTKVYHSIVDVNYVPRLTSFRLAIQKITDAGFVLPGDLLVHLPKYGRNIDQVSECVVAGSTPRAVFNAPNFIHLRGDTVKNPIDEKIDGQWKNLSTQIEESEGDASGAPSVVHEMGHMMHYRNAPGKFLGLHGTTFTGVNGNLASTQVSAYGSNPREFVAEVFLGLIYGKNFSDDVLRMYRDLGGAIPPGIAAYVATL